MIPERKTGLVAAFLVVGLCLINGCCAQEPPGLASTMKLDPVVVSTPEDPQWDLSNRERVALKNVGFTQVSMPFGVLIAADQEMPRAHVRQAAAILAEMMDQDMDGVVDDSVVADLLRQREVCWLAMPMDPDHWERQQLPQLERVLGYDIIIPEWWMEIRGDQPDERARAVMVEEVHHFITQFGLSEAYPEIFGVNDWESVIARETQRAQCDFWQHPENDCPGSPAEIGGDCSDANCDVVEFYQQVVVMRAGMQPGWLGIGFPEDRDQLEALLGEEIRQAMDDPRYHQLRTPLTFQYPMQ
ncbi:MAG: hypothetical protein CMJ39_06855 [Phycisphaerae bacterium]|nr:hypothetical protein [Phycisphaerae bacterium]|tara:strand:- start:1562 stop:2461 length:900 start_codon:yes stop_codon:yes gene_type:complete